MAANRLWEGQEGRSVGCFDPKFAAALRKFYWVYPRRTPLTLLSWVGQPYSRGVEAQTKHRLNSNEPHSRSTVENVGSSGAKLASPDHPRRAPPLCTAAILCWHAGVLRAQGGSRHGWVPKCKSLPPGLERAPPRPIPGGGLLRCFPLFAVTPPVIPTGVGRP